MSVFFMFAPRPSWPTSSCATTRPASGRSSAPRGSPRAPICTAASPAPSLATALCSSACPAGIWIGTFMPWVDPETVGPNRLGDYLYAYPRVRPAGLFLTSALFFALATVTRSMMATYVGVVAVLILSDDRHRSCWAQSPSSRLAALGRAVRQRRLQPGTKYWTAAERNTLNPPLEGVLPVEPADLDRRRRGAWRPGYHAVPPTAAGETGRIVKLQARPRPGAEAVGPCRRRASAGQRPGAACARARLRDGQVFKSPAFVRADGARPRPSPIGDPVDLGRDLRHPVLPVTRVVIGTDQGIRPHLRRHRHLLCRRAGLARPRPQDARDHRRHGAPDWTFLVPKTLASRWCWCRPCWSACSPAIGCSLKGYTDFELGKYLLWYVLPQTVEFHAMIAMLAVFIQALSPNKFVGWGLMVVYHDRHPRALELGFDHNLYNTARASPRAAVGHERPGRLLDSAAWWTAGLLDGLRGDPAGAVYGLWRRGTRPGCAAPEAPAAPAVGPAGAIGGAALAFVGDWAASSTSTPMSGTSTAPASRKSAAGRLREGAAALREARPSRRSPTSSWTVDLHPARAQLTTRGSYVLVNNTGAPLREVHLRLERDLKDGPVVQGARWCATWPTASTIASIVSTADAAGRDATMSLPTCGTARLQEQRQHHAPGRQRHLREQRSSRRSIGMSRDGC
jgi:ABC-2 type transport system permease protein